MRRLGFVLFLMAAQVCLGQAIASRRYAERTVTQYSFGPLTPIAPYNNAAGGLVSTTALQPTPGILDNNNFSSTGNFTVIRKDDATTTFTVSGNVGTIVTGSAASQTLVLGSTASTSVCTVPNCFVQIEVNANGTTSGTDIIAVGLATAGDTTEFMAQYTNSGSGVLYTNALVSGTNHNSTNVTIGHFTAPWYLGFALTNNYISAWYNTGSGWIFASGQSIDSWYDPRTSGLSGFSAAIKVFTSQVTTWQFSNLKTGIYAGMGLRDTALVTYPDGRPYMQGSLIYMLATVGGPSSTVQASGNGIFSYDLIGGTLTYLGTIGVSRGLGIFEDQAGQIIYNPATNTEQLFIGSWGSSSTPTTYYVSQSILTDDWLSASIPIHITPAATQMTFPASANPYDANAACTQWNYSANTCGNWQVSFTQAGTTKAVYSASDPSANSWTSLFSVSNPTYEGTRINRTATTYLGTGVAYPTSASEQISAGTSNLRLSTSYNQAGTSLGNMNFQSPAGHSNPPHPQLVSFGNTEYWISFSDTIAATFSASISTSMGNLIVATAPKYATPTSWPTLVNSATAFTSSSVSSLATSTGIYTSTITLAAGDLVFGFMRMGSTPPTAPVFSDGLGNSYTCGAMNVVGTGGTDFGCWSFVTTPGVATFTGSWTTAAANDGLQVLQFRPNGYISTNDVPVTYSNSTVTATQAYTTGSFSTTAKGLIIVCGDGQANARISEGTIGPYQSAFGIVNGTAATACMGTVTTSAQVSITGNMGLSQGSTVKWGGMYAAFK